jgi:cytochrome P450
LFREFVHVILEAVDIDEADRIVAVERVVSYIHGHVEAHRAADTPADDLIGYLCAVRDADGDPLTIEHIVGTVILLLVAGIDTTWSAIGSALHHLATHPDDRAALLADPALLPTAIEELLRAYAPVTMARVVAEDHVLEGRQLRRGERVLLPFPAANRDPQVFTDPDTVILDRAANRHSAFGLGIHRCLGSNLARLEMRIAVEAFLHRFPSFESAGEVRWSVGQVRGPRELLIRICR